VILVLHMALQIPRKISLNIKTSGFKMQAIS